MGLLTFCFHSQEARRLIGFMVEVGLVANVVAMLDLFIFIDMLDDWV